MAPFIAAFCPEAVPVNGQGERESFLLHVNGTWTNAVLLQCLCLCVWRRPRISVLVCRWTIVIGSLVHIEKCLLVLLSNQVVTAVI